MSSKLQSCDERQMDVYNKGDRLRAHKYRLMQSKAIYVCLSFLWLCFVPFAVQKARVKVCVKQKIIHHHVPRCYLVYSSDACSVGFFPVMMTDNSQCEWHKVFFFTVCWGCGVIFQAAARRRMSGITAAQHNASLWIQPLVTTYIYVLPCK